MHKILVLLPLLSLAGCGGSTATAQPETTATTPSVDGAGPAQAGGPGSAFSGAAGLLAAVDGTTLQVQTPTSQTTVTYGAATTFTSTVVASATAATIGSCVPVRSADPSGTVPTQPPTAVTATSVAVSSPVGGSCRGPGAGGRRGRGAGRPAPPAGVRGGDRAYGAGLVGTVTAVHSSTLQVRAVDRGPSPASPAPVRMVTVTVTSGTTWTRTVPATASALRVGLCVTARGRADSTGAVAATTISLRPAVGGACGTGRRGAGAPGA